MIPYEVISDDGAEKDILQIVNYMRCILCSNQAARNFLDALEEKFKKIAEEPHMYKPQKIGREFYRKAIVNKYVVAFSIDEASHTVHITAIGHTLQKGIKIKK